MKKIALGFVVLSVPVFASDCNDGWHVGVGAGIVSQSTSFHQEACFLYGDNQPAYPIILDANLRTAARAKLGSSRATRLAAALELGYSKVLCNNCYIGGVVSADFTSNKTGKNLVHMRNGVPAIGVFEEARVVNDGVVPFLGIRFGYYNSACKGSLGVRLGGAYVGSKVHLKEFTSKQCYTAKLKNFTPLIGLEFAKELTNGFGVKVQADYRFGTKRVLRGAMHSYDFGMHAGAEETSVKLDSSGIAVRVMGTCNLSAVM